MLLFLVAPILAIVPLSFNAEPFFTYPMPGFSLQWYREFIDSAVWQLALRNSLIVAFFATVHSFVFLQHVVEALETPMPLDEYLDTVLDVWTRGAVVSLDAPPRGRKR